MAEPSTSLKSNEAVLINSCLGVDLSSEELAQVAALMAEQKFKKGARILKEGSNARDIYIIKEGQVSVMLDFTVLQNFEERIARLNEHEIFGEFAFVSGEPRTATIQAESRVTLILLRYDDLNTLFANNPVIAYKIIRNIAVIVVKRINEQHRMVRKLLFCN